MVSRAGSFFWLLSLTATIGLVPSIDAQQLTGAIVGTVTDSSGGVVAGAEVRVVNTATNLTVRAQTSKEGSYQFANLPGGTYSVTFTMSGFKTEQRTEILVEANRTTTLPGKLEPGAVSTTVQVSGTPLMNEVDTTRGYVLDEQAINNTPLGTGSFTQLAILSPGVSADFLSSSGTNAGLGNQAIWANGQRDTSNSFSINGVAANNLFNGKSTSTVASSRFTSNTGAFSSAGSPGENETSTSVYDSVGNSLPTPAPEMMQELRVNTAMYDASQGGKSGAQITVVTRSGTNSFHGQAYDHLQNTFFNAAPFFRNASTAIAASNKVPQIHYNRFGGTVGGPIIKDKLFFFFGYQGVRNSDASNGSQNVTVPLHLTDDRSAAALSAIAQTDFGKTIAASQIDPAALKLMNFKLGANYFIPSAQITDPAAATQLRYNVYLQGPATFQQNQYSGSLDYNFGSVDRLAAKLLSSYNPTSNAFSGGASTFGFPQVNRAGSSSAVLDNTTIVKPTLTWQQKAGFVRTYSYVQTQQPLTPGQVGIDILGGNTNFPAIKVSESDATNSALRNSLTLGSSFSNANAGTYQNQFTGSTSVNWVLGRHTVYMGGTLDYNQLNIVNNANNVGAVSFASFGDFLTGSITPSSTTYTLGASNRYYRAALAGAFIQDNFKLRSNLSISLGLRYDYNGPLSEKYGLLTNFNPAAYSYNASTDTVMNTGLQVAGNNKTLGTPGVSDSTLTGRQWGLGPRIGIVWSPSRLHNVVFRTGFGLFYDRGEYFTEFSPGAGPGGVSGPFGITLAAPFVQKVTAVAGATLSAPFAGAVLPPPVTTLAGLNSQIPNLALIRTGATNYTFGGYDPANVLPYTESWSFDVQWQPKNNVQLTLGYVGNRSLHQVMPIPFNQPHIATSDHPINGEIYSYGWNVLPVESLKTFDGGNTDLRTPYTGYATNSVLYKTEGIATYNALQFGLRKRLSKGLQITAAYTWSHTLDEQSGLGLFFNGNDPLNPGSSYGTSSYDRPHVAVVQYSYQIPGLHNAHSWVARVVNGWALNGVTTFQSGFPFNAYDFSGAVASIYYSHFVSIIDPVLPLKPGVTVKQAELQGTTGFDVNKPFLDANAFYIPAFAPGQNGVPPCATVSGNQVCDTFETGFGATSRNTFRGPFQWRADVTAVKTTRVTERVSIRYQADFFNVFNHTSFDAASASPSSYRTTTTNGAAVPSTQSFLASFGTVQRTIGSPRFLQMSLSVLF